VKKKLLIALGLVVLLAAGAAVAAYLRLNDTAEGHLDTELEGVSVVAPPPETTSPTTAPSTVPTAEPEPKPGQAYAYSHSDRLCWPTFGRNGRRAQALPEVPLGKPIRHFWIRGLGGYIEYPPSYCKGVLYVNTVRGTTFAINAHNGAIVWKRWTPGEKPSTPAIAGDRLIVSSKAGTVTAFHRLTGKLLWQVRVRGRVESSPIVERGTVFFGATDGRLFAVDVRNGRIRWAYNTGGRINSSPTVFGPRVCITTYAGSIFCLRRSNGAKLWSTYVKRDFVRYESFYASASTDGRRLFTIARSGRVVALNARNGRVLWTRRLPAWGYSTPAVAFGKIFVGDFTGTLRALNAATGRELWRRRVGSRILGPSLVVGRLVFFSTLGTTTYAARVGDGRLVWRIGMGKYSPGIATDRHYFFSLNGVLIAFWGQRTTEYGKKGPHLVRTRDVLKTN
jgi:outer membrane protein assembly factor BamB